MRRFLLVLAVLVVSLPTGAFGEPTIEREVYEELSASADATAYVIIMLREAPPRPRGRQVDRRADVAAAQRAVLSSLPAQDFKIAYQYKTFAAMTGRVTADGLRVLAAHPDVVSVGVDARGRASLETSVPFIGADVVHTFGIRGQGMTVAVLDTGIESDHPDLADDIAPGAMHFLNQGAMVGPGAEDDNGHGTNVSGIITGRGFLASVGVAPDADILAVKVLRADGTGWLSDWAAGIDYVTSVVDDYTKLGVINMSLGSFLLFGVCPCDNATSSNQALQAALQASRNADIVSFASSGNEGSVSSMTSPACLSGAVAVAAVYDQNLGREPNTGTYQSNFGLGFGNCFDDPTFGDRITCFSNRSPCNMLAAPGRAIRAAGLGGGTSTYTGTSQAAPHCAALAALMWQSNRGLTPDQIVTAMKATGRPTSDPASTSPNPVRIDAPAAIAAVAPGAPIASRNALMVIAALLAAFVAWRRWRGVA